MIPVLVALTCLAIFAGLIAVWRVVMRRSAGESLRNVTVSRAWLTEHMGEDRS